MKKTKHIKTSKRLKDAMAAININASTLSKRSGVSEASVSQYINGSHAPSNITAGKMATVLNCSPLYLMGFDIEENHNKFDPLIAELTDQVKGFSPEDKRHIIEYAKLYSKMIKNKKGSDDHVD
jgi:transcriptional regulator with XRE-family HTH domain